MGGRYLIRPTGSEDAIQLARLERELFTDPWSAASFRELCGADSLAVFEGETLVGYLIGRIIGEQAEILNLGVSPPYRRRGHARRLVLSFLQKAADNGVATVFLEVRESNMAARELYRDLGFKPIGRQRRYYSDPIENAIVLARDLDQT